MHFDQKTGVASQTIVLEDDKDEICMSILLGMEVPSSAPVSPTYVQEETGGEDKKDKSPFLVVELYYSPEDMISKTYKKEINVLSGSSPSASRSHHTFFLVKVLAKQKHYMRCHFHKPKDMTWRDFMLEVLEINTNLEVYSRTVCNGEETDQEEGAVAASKSLLDNKLKELLKFAAPHLWQKRMIEHNFNPTIKIFDAIIECRERIEMLEAIEGTKSLIDLTAKKAKVVTEDKNSSAKCQEGQSNKMHCPLEEFEHD